MKSALCVLVDVLGVPPDLTYTFRTATSQRCKQQPSEMRGERRTASHTVKYSFEG